MGGCFFPRCGNNSSIPKFDANGQKIPITFHMISKNKKHRALIIKKINELRKKHIRRGTNVTKNENGEKFQDPAEDAKICSVHYASDMFEFKDWKNGDKHKYLRNDAVPVYRNQEEKDKAEMNVDWMPTVQDLAPPIGTPRNIGAVAPIILRKRKSTYVVCDGKQTAATPLQSTEEQKKLEKKLTSREPKAVFQPHEMPSTSGYSAPKRTKIVKSPTNDGFNSIRSYKTTTAIPEQSTAAEYHNETVVFQPHEMPSTSGYSAPKRTKIVKSPTNDGFNSIRSYKTTTAIPEQSTAAEYHNETSFVETNSTPNETQKITKNILEIALEGIDIHNDDSFKATIHTKFDEISAQTSQGNDRQIEFVTESVQILPPKDVGTTSHYETEKFYPLPIYELLPDVARCYYVDYDESLINENSETTSNGNLQDQPAHTPPDADHSDILTKRNVEHNAFEDSPRNSTKSITYTQAPAQTPTENIPDIAREGIDNYDDDYFKPATHARLLENFEPAKQQGNNGQRTVDIPHSDGTFYGSFENQMFMLTVQTINESTYDGQHGTICEGTIATETSNGSDIPDNNCMPVPLPASSLPQTFTIDSDPSIHYIDKNNQGCDYPPPALNKIVEATSNLQDPPVQKRNRRGGDEDFDFIYDEIDTCISHNFDLQNVNSSDFEDLLHIVG